MSNFTPPEKLVIVAEEEEVEEKEEELDHVEEDGKLNYVDIKSRSIGFLFRYEEHQYLYRYPEYFEGKEGDKLEFLEKRNIESESQIMYEAEQNPDDEFWIVEIIEIDDGFILCNLMKVFCEDTEFWILKNLQEIAIRLYNGVECNLRSRHGVIILSLIKKES